MEHTMQALSLRSRITSISNSFHPSTDSSINTSLTGLKARPFEQIASNSASLRAIPPPAPPSVKPGRRITGHVPISARTFRASSIVCADPDRGTASPMSVMAFLNRPRSSARRITSAVAPISST